MRTLLLAFTLLCALLLPGHAFELKAAVKCPGISVVDQPNAGDGAYIVTRYCTSKHLLHAGHETIEIAPIPVTWSIDRSPVRRAMGMPVRVRPGSHTVTFFVDAPHHAPAPITVSVSSNKMAVVSIEVK